VVHFDRLRRRIHASGLHHHIVGHVELSHRRRPRTGHIRKEYSTRNPDEMASRSI
jgi:hypothetical protein